jgi:predicted O-linked N-acetylglucosamine transferase (SPINDLY family)
MTQPEIQQLFDQGMRHHEAGRLLQARGLYLQVLAEQPDHAQALHFLGVIAFQENQNDSAIDLLRRAIALRPDFAEAHSNLGNALKKKGQLEEAITEYRMAIALNPNLSAAPVSLAKTLRDNVQFDEAIAVLRQVITLRPTDAEAFNHLGNALQDGGQKEEAIAAYRQAISLRPSFAEAHGNLGNAFKKWGRAEEAIAAYRRAIALRPNLAGVLNNLGTVLSSVGQIEEAIGAYRQAIAQRPDFAQVHNNLGIALKEKGRLEEAIAACRAAIAIQPEYAVAYNNLGTALSEQGSLDDAIAAFRQAIAINPQLSEAYTNLGGEYKDRAQLDEAIASFRKSIELRSSDSQVGSNLIYTLYFHPASDPKSLLNEHLEWARVHSEPLKHLIRPHANDRTADRRLKIGYVSPDFRNHCQSCFTMPLLSNHDRSRFEIYCYSSVEVEDSVTARLRGYADQWREVKRVPDEDLARKVREDQIDILVDLVMHMARGRPLLFARKPAPVQVAWLGYPGTTGMSAMDYRLTDPYLDPRGTDESDYIEKTIRLQESFWCYDPLEEEPLPGPLPALTSGRFTFGCLNNFCKTNEGVLKLWATVMASVPNSRLLLLAPRGHSRRAIIDSLAEKKIDASRVEFVEMQPRPEYLRTFNRIDLCLDTFPSNGHTTSMDSIWMGVPVVSLTDGKIPMARGGVSILSNVGLHQFLAKDSEAFVQIAVGLTAELPKLAQIRNGLRERMRKSPLMDGPRFTRNIEAAYRQMWKLWCNTART